MICKSCGEIVDKFYVTCPNCFEFLLEITEDEDEDEDEDESEFDHFPL